MSGRRTNESIRWLAWPFPVDHPAPYKLCPVCGDKLAPAESAKGERYFACRRPGCDGRLAWGVAEFEVTDEDRRRAEDALTPPRWAGLAGLTWLAILALAYWIATEHLGW